MAQSRTSSQAEGIWANTQLRDLSFDGLNSNIVRSAAQQGFELSHGVAVDLARWYSPEFPNLTASFHTQLGRDFALIWGGSLGETGQKYALGPTGIFGLSYQRRVGAKGTFSVELVSYFGGELYEQACTGDYGALGGVQRVNCRLAASTLSPKATLQHLWNEPATSHTTLRATYTLRF